MRLIGQPAAQRDLSQRRRMLQHQPLRVLHPMSHDVGVRCFADAHLEGAREIAATEPCGGGKFGEPQRPSMFASMRARTCLICHADKPPRGAEPILSWMFASLDSGCGIAAIKSVAGRAAGQCLVSIADTSRCPVGRWGSVRQRGGICGVAEVALDHAAMVAIWVGTVSISGGVSSAITSVCM